MLQNIYIYRDNIYRELKKTPIDREDYRNKKTNLRTYNRIINRSKTYLKKRYYAEKFHQLNNNIKLTWRLINEVSWFVLFSKPVTQYIYYNNIRN